MSLFLSKERQNYYKAKKAAESRKREARKIVAEDALFIRYYGMDSYLKLFPDAMGFGISWHQSVLDELRRLEREQTAQLLTGMSSAIGSNFSKKEMRHFKRMIKDMCK